MKDIVIDVKKISKKYTINTGYEPDTLRDRLVELIHYPIRFLKGTHKTKTKNFWALKDISFTVRRGEILGIIGKNGAGKSTLLKILTRITEPTHGQVTMRGRVASLLEVGTGFNPELTGRENIYLNGAILGMKRKEIKDKFKEIVEFAGIDEFIDTPVKRYSSGMYVRLAFAVAAHLESDILLIDEVLAVGDLDFQKRSLAKINSLTQNEQKTVIFVSHSLDSIKRLCNRCLYLDKGMVRSNSTNVEKVIEDYSGRPTQAEYPHKWVTKKTKFSQWFTLQQVNVLNEHQKEVGVFRYDEEITIQITGFLHKKHPAFQVGYALYDEKTGELLYWCSFNDLPQEKWPKISLGKMIFETKIPRQMLNEGKFRLEAMAALNKIEWLYQPSNTAPCIYFSIEGGLPENSLWNSYKPGFFAPLSAWHTKNKGEK